MFLIVQYGIVLMVVIFCSFKVLTYCLLNILTLKSNYTLAL